MTQSIFIVDDDADIREGLADLLADEGYAVTTAANGLEALDVLKEAGPPDLLLLDLMMPVMDGWTLRARLLDDPGLARMPVLLLSGAHDVRREAAVLNVAGGLTKPVEIAPLLRAVRSILGERA